MKKIEVDGRTVIIRRCGDHYVAHCDGLANKVFGRSEQECLTRLSKPPSVPLRVKYERA
jgi:hypothetical protein